MDKTTGLSYIPESDLEKQITNTIEEMTIDEDFLKLALEEINKANEKEIDNKDLILKKQESSLKRCQSKLDNLVRLKISPENVDGLLLGDEKFMTQKKEILMEKKRIQEKMGDVDDSCQNWFDLATEYVNFTYRLSKKFKTASIEERREIFQFVYYNPVLSDKKLINSNALPHNFIISAKAEKEATLTSKKLLGKQKEGDLVPSCLLGRSERDSNPRPPA